MIGQPAFEIARGVVMQVYACNADDAMAAIGEVAQRTGTTPEAVVDRLLADHSRAGVADLMSHSPDVP